MQEAHSHVTPFPHSRCRTLKLNTLIFRFQLTHTGKQGQEWSLHWLQSDWHYTSLDFELSNMFDSPNSSDSQIDTNVSPQSRHVWFFCCGFTIRWIPFSEFWYKTWSNGGEVCFFSSVCVCVCVCKWRVIGMCAWRCVSNKTEDDMARGKINVWAGVYYSLAGLPVV